MHRLLSNSIGIVSELGVDLINRDLRPWRSHRREHVLDIVRHIWARLAQKALEALRRIQPLRHILSRRVRGSSSVGRIQVRLVAHLPDLELAAQGIAGQRHGCLERVEAGSVLRREVEVVGELGASGEVGVGFEEAGADALPRTGVCGLAAIGSGGC